MLRSKSIYKEYVASFRFSALAELRCTVYNMCHVIFFSLLLATFEMCSHSFHVTHDNDKTMKLEHLMRVNVFSVRSLLFLVFLLDLLLVFMRDSQQAPNASKFHCATTILPKNSLVDLIHQNALDGLIYYFHCCYFIRYDFDNFYDFLHCLQST